MQSAVKSDNLQSTGNNKPGMTDEAYTEAVDNGSYTNFAKDRALRKYCCGKSIHGWRYLP